MRYGRIVTCACGCKETGVNAGFGYVAACYDRWKRAGRPKEGPPPRRDYQPRPPWNPVQDRSKALLEDYQFLTRQGVTDIDMLADRLGCSTRHVWRLVQAARALDQSREKAGAR
ncbi:hypothetical protein [Microbispora sp. CA-102843]|uniref:hypothetical protein n=1 Tax=Microbispora sp. CA-102843 TaxID=3239952 RepID=UPI003D8E1AB9